MTQEKKQHIHCWEKIDDNYSRCLLCPAMKHRDGDIFYWEEGKQHPYRVEKITWKSRFSDWAWALVIVLPAAFCVTAIVYMLKIIFFGG